MKLQLVAGLGIGVLALSAVGYAAPTKLRRPFFGKHVVAYGFDDDHTRGNGSCTNFDCGKNRRCYDGHRGSDYPLPMGTDVLAPADATVTATFNGCANVGGLGNNCGGSCGNYVKLKLEDGRFVLFCHLQRDSLRVAKGNRVSCGQVVAKSASSGNSSGPHLHFSWRDSSNVDHEPYTGSCSRTPETPWFDQGNAGAGVPTSDQCACLPSPEVCNGKDDDCDGAVDEDGVCEIDDLHTTSPWIGQSPSTDINGDGKADVCGRGIIGFWCHPSDGTKFGAATGAAPLSDESGWGGPSYWSTIRMGDIDGDGKADVCARGTHGLVCWKSNGTGFESSVDGPPWTNDSGWNDPQYYSTIRLLDMDGDGKYDVCARAAKGIVCHKSTDDGFGNQIDGPAWSNEAGYNREQSYATLQTADVNGDGKDDLCIRGPGGVECALSNGEGFPTIIKGPEWSDAMGWTHRQYWSTFRVADINGDGKADVCGRGVAGLFCYLSRGDKFDDMVSNDTFSDANGWDDPANYLTFRTGDINGDGAADICARADAGIVCLSWNGSAFQLISGPALSDAEGWNEPNKFQTFLLADMNGDRKDDLCARGKQGWTCYSSQGNGFGDPITLAEFTDGGGWNQPKYYGTLRFAGPTCTPKPETCNGLDDDCDGIVDEDGVCEGVDPNPSTDAGPGADGGRDGASGGRDGATDTSIGDDSEDKGETEGSCSCRAVGGGSTSSVWTLFAGLAVSLGLARSRYRRR